MAHLGLDVEWSDEAVRQLAEAAAAAREYVQAHPDQAEALVHDPQSVLRAMLDGGFLSTPVDALEAALAATHGSARRRAPFVPRARVRFEGPSQASGE